MNRRSLLALIGLAPVASLAAPAATAGSAGRTLGYATGIAGSAAPLVKPLAGKIEVEIVADLSGLEDTRKRIPRWLQRPVWCGPGFYDGDGI